MAAAELHLRCDVSSLLVSALAALSEAAQRSLQVRNFLVDRLQCAAQPGRLDLDRLTATRAIENGIALEPTELLLELVAAVRAREVDVDLVELQVHGSPFREQ